MIALALATPAFADCPAAPLAGDQRYRDDRGLPCWLLSLLDPEAKEARVGQALASRSSGTSIRGRCAGNAVLFSGLSSGV
jgi:hypothetical protein